MRFTLTYSGRLPSSSNAAMKHQIRTAIHPQLKELWRTHPALAGNNNWIERPDGAGEQEEDQGLLLTEINQNAYASLIHPRLRLYVELDIFLLRPENPGALITHFGDIDNQLKTLFDALRRPVDATEVPKSWSPSMEEQPLHCLLDDDKLITRVSVDTDRLLIPSADTKDVLVIIKVLVKGTVVVWNNIGLIG